ncbi:MAG: hypothetical protein HZB43_10740 [candidate division Zixibacteria bacterium]|nr:hypothetical protein [candidate division Zixibacteria bacterium]
MTPRLGPLRLLTFAGIGISLTASQAYALQITAKADTAKVRVGQKVVITISGSRSDSSGDPQFAGAAINAGPAWKLGGQITQSPTRVGDQIVKNWRFELVALTPESSRVTPVVYLGGDPSLGHRADSILGAPVLLIILPAPQRPIWPWVAGAIIAVAVPAFLIFRSIKKRREEVFERPLGTPLEEALEMLAAIRANRREDRVERYLADLERLLEGYVSRRTGETLTGRTAAEIVAIVATKSAKPETLEALNAILQTCAAARFGGARVSIETLVSLDDQARQTLEQMDSEWV